jgi:hypothetical protein
MSFPMLRRVGCACTNSTRSSAAQRQRTVAIIRMAAEASVLQMPDHRKRAHWHTLTGDYDVAGLKGAIGQQVLARQECRVVAPQPLAEVN